MNDLLKVYGELREADLDEDRSWGWHIRGCDPAIEAKVEMVRRALITREVELQMLMFSVAPLEINGSNITCKEDYWKATEMGYPPAHVIAQIRTRGVICPTHDGFMIEQRSPIYWFNMSLINLALNYGGDRITMEDYFEINRRMLEQIGMKEGYNPGYDARIAGREYVLADVLNATPEDQRERIRVGTRKFLSLFV